MAAEGREWIICGDWNIAHRKIDLKNWRSNQKNSGFMPHERAWLETPYFAPDEAMTLALTTAALRGVDVRLLVPSSKVPQASNMAS